jgi:uncharacterized membrane protein
VKNDRQHLKVFLGISMTRRKRIWALLFLGIAVVAMVLLSAGLSELELFSGRPFSLGRELPAWGEGGTVGGGDILMILLRVFLILAFVLFPFSIIYLIVSPEARKRVLARLALLLLLFIFYYLWMHLRPNLWSEGAQSLDKGLEIFPPASTAPVEFMPNPPPWLTLAASLGLALLIVAMLVGVLWLLLRHRRRSEGTVKRLAQEAQDALDALLTGADLKNTVMRCYFEMARTLDEQRGIKRHTDMTPREFERRLEAAGLPGEPIRKLTWLFEEVRYGTRVPSGGEERQAISCLAAIVEACRSLS